MVEGGSVALVRVYCLEQNGWIEGSSDKLLLGSA